MSEPKAGSQERPAYELTYAPAFGSTPMLEDLERELCRAQREGTLLKALEVMQRRGYDSVRKVPAGEYSVMLAEWHRLQAD